MFGSAIENVWGSRRFLIYYLLTGFGAAILHYLTISPELRSVRNIAVGTNANADTAASTVG